MASLTCAFSAEILPQSVWREIWFYDDFTVEIEIWECAALDKFVINGGRKLHGDVRISGAKNAAVAIIPAAILAEDICRIENVPNINDVTSIARILQEMGAAIRMVNKSTLEIDSRHINSPVASYDLVRHMRASYYLLGALLGRFSHAKVALPGGCNFGVRPIDQHLKGFMALGAEYKLEGGMVNVSADHLTGNHVYLDVVSVGATMNIHIIMSTDSVLDEDINYLFDKDDISKLSFYLTTRREYNKFLDNYIDESLGRDGIYVSTNSKLTRISLPLIEDDEITRVVDNLKVNI